MRAGDIYSTFFKHQHQKGMLTTGGYRPALIVGFKKGKAIAIAIKITRSGPTVNFPHRLKVLKWKEAGLDYQSWVQYDWYNEVDTTNLGNFIGVLHPKDFTRVISAFRSYHGI